MTRARLAARLRPRSRSPAACVAGCSLGGGDDEAAPGPDSTTTTRVEVVEGQGDRQGASTPQGLFKNEGQGVVTVISLFGAGGLESILGGDGGRRRPRLGLRAQRRRRDRHQRPRRHAGRGRGHRARARGLRRVRRRQPRAGEDRRPGPQRRRRAAEDRPEGPHAAPAPARLQRRRPGRLPGRRDRLAVRRAPVAVGRRRLRDRPRHRLAQRRLRDPGRDPDRRGDQPGQLRRPAGRRRRQGDRASTSRSSRSPAAARASASRCRSTSSSARSAPCASPARPSTPTSGSAPCRCTRSWWSASTSRSQKGAWVQEVSPGSPAEKAGIRGGKGEVALPDPELRPRAATSSPRSRASPITDANDLSSVVAQFQPGQEVTVEVRRGGRDEGDPGQARRASAERAASGG